LQGEALPFFPLAVIEDILNLLGLRKSP
jgi:hypothetical protein